VLSIIEADANDVTRLDGREQFRDGGRLARVGQGAENLSVKFRRATIDVQPTDVIWPVVV
jgi:hypothetical protein